MIALLLEIGLLLLLAPWTQFWERNYFVELVPALRVITLNHYVRGAVSGLGLVNLWLAASDLVAVLQQRADA